MRCSKKDIPGKCPFLRFVRSITPIGLRKTIAKKNKSLPLSAPTPESTSLKTSQDSKKIESIAPFPEPLLLSASSVKDSDLKEILQSGHLSKNENNNPQGTSSAISKKILAFSPSKSQEPVTNTTLKRWKNPH